MKKLSTVFFIFTVLFFTLNSAQAAIKVSPSYTELDANTTKKDYISGSFGVSGGKDEVIRCKIYPVFFKYDTKGRFVELEDKGQLNSLMGKIKFYPTEFTCANGESQKIRFTITNLKTLPSGESKVMLFLEDTHTREIVLKRANGTIGGSIAIKTRVGVPIFLDKGNYVMKLPDVERLTPALVEDHVLDAGLLREVDEALVRPGVAAAVRGETGVVKAVPPVPCDLPGLDPG